MRKFTIGLLFMSLLLASACSAVNETISPEFPASERGYVKSNLERETSPIADSGQIQSLAHDNITFALSFYDQIRQDNGNIIFSPISLSLALSMTMAGAETSTEDAMMEALQMTLPEDEVYPTFNALMLAIEESQKNTLEGAEGNNFQLNIANSIWGQVGFDFKENFLDILALNYGAGIYNVDYIQNPEAARGAINNWVKEETEDKIQDIIPPGAINELTRLVLANAIYFNGSWLHPFRETASEEALFTTLNDTEVTVEMMKLFDESLLYAQGEYYQAVNLPYLSTDFAMTIIVPDAGSFSAFEEKLTTNNLMELVNGMRSERVALEMPKFDFESTINANSTLAAMGMAEAFDSGQSDFSGIADVEDLHITDVLHKATITVNETGTEAAAATTVIIGVTSAPAGDPIPIIIDRPFLFLIQHQPSGSILFMGRVTQP